MVEAVTIKSLPIHACSQIVPGLQDRLMFCLDGGHLVLQLAPQPANLSLLGLQLDHKVRTHWVVGGNLHSVLGSQSNVQLSFNLGWL